MAVCTLSSRQARTETETLPALVAAGCADGQVAVCGLGAVAPHLGQPGCCPPRKSPSLCPMFGVKPGFMGGSAMGANAQRPKGFMGPGL